MSDNRVLNFSEFGKKYSQDSDSDIAASYSDFSSASNNFQEGFDDDTYEEGQGGPKRPINVGSEETPAGPNGFNSEESEEMVAPDHSEEEEDDYEDVEGDDEDENSETEDDEDLEDIEEEEWDEDEYGNPEDEDDEDEEDDEEEDEDEDANESISYIVESFDDYVSKSQPRSGQSNSIEDLDFNLDGDIEDSSHDKCIVICKSCGSEKEIEPGIIPFGKDEESNPNSWWQGSTMGMQCGCNM
jgi:hypothetical protein